MADRRFRLEAVIRAVDQATAPIRRIGQAAQRVSRATGLDRVAAAGAGAGQAVVGVGRAARATLAPIAAVGGAVGQLVRGFSRAGDDVAKTSQRLGLSVTELQRWRYAAELTGTSAETADMAIQRFGSRASDAAAGTGEAKDALAELGIQLTDSAGRMRSTDALLRDVSDALSRVESASDRNRIAMRLFDSEGVRLGVTLAHGSAEIRRLGDESERLGHITEEDVRAAERWTDSMYRLRWALRATGHALARDLLPHLEPLVGRLRELAVAGVIGGRLIWSVVQLAAALARLAGAVVMVGVRLLVLAVRAGPAAVRAAVWLRREWGLLGTRLGLLGLQLRALGAALARAAARMWAMAVGAGRALAGALAGLARALVGVIASTWAWTAALLASPVTWVVAGLVALAAGVWLVYRHWDGIVEWWSGLWDGIEARWTAMLAWLGAQLGALDAWWQGVDLAGAGAAWIDGLWDGIEARWAAMLAWLDAQLGALDAWWQGVDLAGAGAAWIDGLWDGIEARWTALTAWLGAAVERLLGWMPDSMREGLGLGGAVSAAPERRAGESILGARGGRTQVGGEVRIRIEGAPPGTRIEGVRADNPDVPLAVDAGILMAGT